jgi:phospholipase/carboxylesterase
MRSDPHLNQPVLKGGASLKEAAGAVILLHGRGATAEDILGLEREFRRPDLAYLAPQAAEHTWYPNSFLAPIDKNEPWLTSALDKVRTIVDEIALAGISHDKIVLAGFSQGACLASEFVARSGVQYGGLIAFTGGLIGPLGTELRYSGKLKGMPVFLGSGDPDAHVPWQRVQESGAIFSEMGGEVTIRRYPGMGHTINQEEILEARRVLPNT